MNIGLDVGYSAVKAVAGPGRRVTFPSVSGTPERARFSVKELARWKNALEEWMHNGGEQQPGDFDAAFMRLYNAGLGDTWADANLAGGGLDALAEAVTEEVMR